MDYLLMTQILLVVILVGVLGWLLIGRKSTFSADNILGAAGINDDLVLPLNAGSDLDTVTNTYFPSKNPYIRKTLPFILSKRNHNEPIDVTISKAFTAVTRPNRSPKEVQASRRMRKITDALGTKDIEGSHHTQWLSQVRPFSKKRMEPDTLEPETFIKSYGLRLPQPIPYKNPIIVNDSITMEDLSRNVNASPVL